MRHVRGRKKEGVYLFGGTTDGERREGDGANGEGAKERHRPDTRKRKRKRTKWRERDETRKREAVRKTDRDRTERPGSECAHQAASIPPPAFPACTHSCSCTAAVARSCAHARLRARLSLA